MTNEQLTAQAKKIRFEAVRMVYEGKDGHPGPALSIADIVAYLFYEEMNLDPQKPSWEERDRFILSKGHSCPILYAALSEKGYFGEPVKHFNLRALGSMFQGHPVMNKTPGVDMTSGSLGNGIAIGAGMAIAAKHKGLKSRVNVIVGDGELQEGIIWEGVNLATARKLDNLVVVVDKNNWQSGGTVTDIIGSNNISDRFGAFGWNTVEISAHNFDQIRSAFKAARAEAGRPTAIVATAVKGKGLDFMEDDNNWHKGVPTDVQYKCACEQIGC